MPFRADPILFLHSGSQVVANRSYANILMRKRDAFKPSKIVIEVVSFLALLIGYVFVIKHPPVSAVLHVFFILMIAVALLNLLGELENYRPKGTPLTTRMNDDSTEQKILATHEDPIVGTIQRDRKSVV